MVSYLSENCAHIISQIAHQPTTTAHLQFTYTIIIRRFMLEKKERWKLTYWSLVWYRVPTPTAQCPPLICHS